MSKPKIDPDVIGREDPAYWAAALVLAIQNRNLTSEETARLNLARLGFRLCLASELPTPEKAEGAE